MKKETDPSHAEHKSVLDALATHLNDEIERGLKLLDTCATQIGQAKWILVNVKKTVKEFDTECPVCEDKAKAAKSKAKESAKHAVVIKKDPPPPAPASSPKKSHVPAAAPAVKSAPKPFNRPGPRSKTRPKDEPEDPPIPRVNLPKTKTIIVKQTAVKVLLNNISPYLKGLSAININNLTDYDPCVQEKVDDLNFKPIFMRTASGKVSKYSTNQTGPPRQTVKKAIVSPKPVGLASKKFMDDLSAKDKERNNSSTKKYISRELITDTSSSDSDESDEDSKPLVALKKSKRESPPPKKKSHSHHSSREKDKHKHSDKEKEKHRDKDKSSSSKHHKPSTSTSSKKTDHAHAHAPEKEKEKDKLESSSSSKPASTRMTITLKPESNSLFDKLIKEKTNPSSSSSSTKPKTIDFTKRGSNASGHHSEAESDASSVGKLSVSKLKPSTPVKKDKNESSAASHVSVDMEPPPDAKPIVTVKSKPGPASRKNLMVNSFKATPPPRAPSSVTSEASHRSDTASHHSDAGSERSVQPSRETIPDSQESKPEKDDANATLKRKLSPDSSSTEPPKKKKDINISSVAKAAIFAKLQKFVKGKTSASIKLPSGPKPEKKPDSSVSVSTTTKVEETPGKDDKDDEGMELGDDIIGKCIDDLETEKSPEKSTAAMPIKFPRPPSFNLTTSPAPTLQDCVSPTGVDKFFKGPEDEDNEAGHSSGVSSAQIARVQELVKRLSHSKFDDAAALHSQDKISELFADLSRTEITTERKDLQLNTWYLIEDETLGFATTADSVAAIQWKKITADKMKAILAELETYTLSCIR